MFLFFLHHKGATKSVNLNNRRFRASVLSSMYWYHDLSFLLSSLLEFLLGGGDLARLVVATGTGSEIGGKDSSGDGRFGDLFSALGSIEGSNSSSSTMLKSIVGASITAKLAGNSKSFFSIMRGGVRDLDRDLYLRSRRRPPRQRFSLSLSELLLLRLRRWRPPLRTSFCFLARKAISFCLCFMPWQWALTDFSPFKTHPSLHILHLTMDCRPSLLFLNAPSVSSPFDCASNKSFSTVWKLGSYSLCVMKRATPRPRTKLHNIGISDMMSLITQN